jgi:O-antigen ligase
MITPRSFETTAALDTIEANAEGIWSVARFIFTSLTLGFTMLCILICFINITKCKQRFKNYPFSLRIFSIGLSLSPMLATFATGDSVKLNYLAFFFLLITTFTLTPINQTLFLRQVRVSFLVIFIYGSLLAAILAPSWGIQSDYEGSLAIFRLRLFGMANHANSLAPFALIVIMLSFFPEYKLRGELFHRVSSIIVLFFSQSKTTWIISLICLIIYHFLRWKSIHNSLLKALLGMSVVGIIIYSFAFGAYYFGSQTIAVINNPDVITLTGRLFIWLYAWSYWLENPWIGHGYSAWSSNKIIENLSVFKWAAPNAHNQFLQSLTEGGIIAEFFLFGFFCTLFYLCIKAKSSSRLLLILLLLIVIINSITEITITYAVGSSLLLTWVVIVATVTRADVELI